MNSKLIAGLASFCIACILIIIGEWLYASWTEKTILTSLTSTDKKLSPDEMPHIELNEQSEESYVDLVARPLFIKGRKPIDEPSPEAIQNALVPVVFDWELNGVYTTANGLSALFSRSKTKVAKDNYRKIGIGAELDGWKIVEIYQDKALLKLGAQEKELLLRKIKPKDPSKKTTNLNTPNTSPPKPQESEMPAESEPENVDE
jgi:hypothetical protein